MALALGSLALSLSLTGCGNATASKTDSPAPAVPVASALGPQLGYLWISADRTLRPIMGIPGASQIGQSVVPAGQYVGAASSATAKLAILQAADGSFDRISLPAGSPISLGLTLPPGALLRLSPSAGAALVFTPGSTFASLITGLASSPRVQSVSAPAPFADAAVSDSGAVAFESSHAVAVIPWNGGAVAVGGVGAPGGLAFLPSSLGSHDDLLFADFTGNTLTLVRSTTGNPVTQTIATSGLLHLPSFIGVSDSGRWALIANSGSHDSVRVDLSSMAVDSVACACQPTLSEPLADEGSFRVTGLASGPNWLVDAAAATPRVLFIPSLANPTIAAVAAPAFKP